MGYSLYIGQGRLLKHKTLVDSSYARPRTIIHKGAPAYGEPTDGTNMRWPSYSSWTGFVKFVNLRDMFFNLENGLMRNRSGCEPLLATHKAQIDFALTELMAKYPLAVARMSDNGIYNQPYQNSFLADGHLARLAWLKYWVDYALKHFSSPVFYNS